MNPEKKKALKYLRSGRTQLDMVISMLEQEKYCIDIANQILAVDGLLRKANLEILEQHLNHCVKQAFEQGSGEEKVEEVMKVISRIMDAK